MKKQLILIVWGLVGLFVVGGVSAGWKDSSFYDKAKVVKVKPIYKPVRINYPEEHCWNERRQRLGSSHRSNVPVVVGGIIGGVAGNQFGHGSGKKAMTVAGALLGAAIGDDIAEHGRHSHGRPHYTTERHCEVRDSYREEDELVGYRVKYRYKGHTFTTRTREHPGKWIRVRLSIDPVERH